MGVANSRTERRLAAILSADVVGYSRLMGADEAGTLARLKALRVGVIDPVIAGHNGRIVKLMGDGALVEFASAVDAVACAVEVQRRVAEADDGPEDQRIAFRVGVNLGDVIVEGDDIYGDGVNIAARLQEIADAGGVAISANAHEQVEGKLDAAFDDLGERRLKNIAKPVRVYRARLGGGVGERMAPPPEFLPLPEKPSIAVLPFVNLSSDAEQEYFSDGITEDIITALARVRWLFVISSNSSFTYKGGAADLKRVADELGVRYVLEGSVRRGGGGTGCASPPSSSRRAPTTTSGPNASTATWRTSSRCKTRSPIPSSPPSCLRSTKPRGRAPSASRWPASTPGTSICAASGTCSGGWATIYARRRRCSERPSTSTRASPWLMRDWHAR